MDVVDMASTFFSVEPSQVDMMTICRSFPVYRVHVPNATPDGRIDEPHDRSLWTAVALGLGVVVKSSRGSILDSSPSKKQVPFATIFSSSSSKPPKFITYSSILIQRSGSLFGGHNNFVFEWMFSLAVSKPRKRTKESARRMDCLPVFIPPRIIYTAKPPTAPAFSITSNSNCPSPRRIHLSKVPS